MVLLLSVVAVVVGGGGVVGDVVVAVVVGGGVVVVVVVAAAVAVAVVVNMISINSSMVVVIIMIIGISISSCSSSSSSSSSSMIMITVHVFICCYVLCLNAILCLLDRVSSHKVARSRAGCEPQCAPERLSACLPICQSYTSKGIGRQGIGSFCKEFQCSSTMNGAMSAAAADEAKAQH